MEATDKKKKVKCSQLALAHAPHNPFFRVNGQHRENGIARSRCSTKHQHPAGTLPRASSRGAARVAHSAAPWRLDFSRLDDSHPEAHPEESVLYGTVFRGQLYVLLVD